MDSEIDLKNKIQKAQRADELLNDPLMQEFIISVRGDLLNKFESTSLINENERLAAWHQSQVFKLFLEKFTKTIKDGKNAKLSLLDKAKNKLRNVI